MNPLSRKVPILIVDDESAWLNSLKVALRMASYEDVTPCTSAEEALSLLTNKKFEVALLDICLPDRSGIELLSRIRSEHPSTAVIMITALNEVERAVECIRLGALNYIVKPSPPTQLVALVDQIVQQRQLERENRALRQALLQPTLKSPEAFASFLTSDRSLYLIFHYIEAIAPTTEPVLITGETGTGKELVARAIHRLSGRQGGFIAVNVAGLDDTAFSDTLFGHKRGAFTGATDVRAGLVESARGGTLFLDEMGSLDPRSQVKLLRLLQEGEYHPLGVDTPRKADVRILAATNKDLLHLVEEGLFRRDLYYRLDTHHVHLPPLRERRGDIPLLVRAFLAEAAEKYDKAPPICDENVMQILQAYPFPGNIRELRAVMIDAAIRFPGEEIRRDWLAERLGITGCDVTYLENVGAASFRSFCQSVQLIPPLEEAQKVLIQEAMSRTGGNISAAASLLGITRQALHQRLKNHPEYLASPGSPPTSDSRNDSTTQAPKRKKTTKIFSKTPSLQESLFPYLS